jgi:hypothetical protein
MKTKFPSVIRFSEYSELYANVDFNNLLENQIVNQLESKIMSNLRESILEFMNLNKNIFEELESKMVMYKRIFILENLDNFISISIQKDLKSINKNEYRTAKVMWPEVGKDDVAVRISLGRNPKDIKERKKGITELEIQKVRNALKERM